MNVEQIMTKLLEIKALLMGIYKKFDYIINPIGKFIVSLMVIVNLNQFFSYSPLLSKMSVNVAIAGLAAFLPGSWFILMLIAAVGLQLFEVSLYAAAIVVAVMLIVYFLFARLQPKYAFLIILVPFLNSMGLVYILPLFAGLFLGPGAVISLGVGVGIYRFAEALPGLLNLHVVDASLMDSPDMVMEMYKYVLEVLSNDRSLVLTAGVFGAVVLVMYFVKKIELDYIWYITIGAGAIVMIFGFTIGSVVLKTDVAMGSVILGTILASLIVAVMQFFKFSLDYSRSERLQFEDDDYYYYVKTIPKVKATKKKKEVKKITEAKNPVKRN